MNEGKKRLKQGKVEIEIAPTMASQIRLLKASKSTMNLFNRIEAEAILNPEIGKTYGSLAVFVAKGLHRRRHFQTHYNCPQKNQRTKLMSKCQTYKFNFFISFTAWSAARAVSAM